MTRNHVKVAIVQQGPVYLDLGKSLEKASAILEEAARRDAGLVVFGEAWLSGYPAWLDPCDEVNYWDHEPVKEIFARTYRNSIEVPGKETALLAEMARKLGLVIVMGANEKVVSGRGNGSIYNSLLIITPEGGIANHHRKLVPTYTEKLVWAPGDGNGLKAVQTDFGRVGGLICWEHWMPHARQAMHDNGENIHVAVWPWVHDAHQLASRHYAFEGRCYVVAAGQVLRAGELPPECVLPETLADEQEKLLLRGGSCVFGPDGTALLEPQMDKDEVLYYDIADMEKTVKERMNLDVSGHYSRPDIFDFKVNRNRNH
jgi:predicted amidohydrolase